MNYPSEANEYLNAHVDLMNSSHRKLLGTNLVLDIPPGQSLAKALYFAPFVVLSHNADADPVFNYANLKAQELFGFSWDEFTSLPSRMSAEPGHRHERERLLAEVSQNGYTVNYQGVRIAKNGNRFLIKDVVVWNLYDNSGAYGGQAARFENWRVLD